ncbi:TRAP transporter small permease [Halanaerobium hydrogeniformans]|uniref:Tripartite ATP-independent periplasmic transporter DctQ component n=1 Tax=Halanaerobium hydrogeniformans TaxID=656519 RepID=E4RPS9_HALHG|nr:TRAP transporter small permease [Halanaerobium hydrogeniformans]ADQ13963.1 Tripartite ATP-independent periplasmic transporter DctQ component [Halanaerobium hydrogeniformans]
MKKFIKNFEEYLSCFFISITVILVIINVIMRYIFNSGIFWTEELATYSFVWSVFIGASAAYKKRMHIGIDLLTRIVPKKLKELSKMLINFFMVLINGYIAYLSVIFVLESVGRPTPVLGISSAFVNASLLVSFSLMTFHAAHFFIKNLLIFLSDEKEKKLRRAEKSVGVKTEIKEEII